MRSELSPDFPKSVWSMVKGSLTFPFVQSTRWFGSALPWPRERFGEWSFTKGSNRIQEEQPSSITPLEPRLRGPSGNATSPYLIFT